MAWGMSSTVSRDEFIEINGQDEIYDGAICGTDMDMATRLIQISKHKRVVSKNYVYEINDIPYKYNIRDDTILRAFTGQSPKPRYIVANSYKPEYIELRRYERWHKKNIGELNPNWDAFMNVEPIDLEKENKLRRLGEIVYENS